MARLFVMLLFITSACSLDAGVEDEIKAMEPDLWRLLEFSVNGTEKGAAYNFTADFVDRWGYRISGSKNLEDSIDALGAGLEAEGLLENVHFEKAMVPHWVRCIVHTQKITNIF